MTVSFHRNGEAPVAPRDAATVLVLRDTDAGPEVFFVRRNAHASFMGGVHVFPGGRLDTADTAADVPCDLDALEAAQRLGEDNPARARGLYVAAIRECLEESGILFATETLSAQALSALRRRLEGLNAPPIGPTLRAAGVTFAARALTPLSRWITPKLETRRFDARYFLARAPEHTEHASPDGRETVASAWLSPREAIERARRREIVLSPPTWRTLESLKDLNSVDEVFAHAPTVFPPIEPEVVFEDGAVWVVLPASERLATHFRCDDGCWIPLPLP